MTLSPQERKQFFRHYLPLLYYAAVYEGLLPETASVQDFSGLPLEEKVQSRNVLFTDPETLSGFRRDNRRMLTAEWESFATNVQKGLYSSFVVLKQYAKFSVLQHVDDQRFYQVVNITDPFSEMLPYLPVYVKTAIFNFNGKIVCDGLVESGVQIGPNMKAGMLAEYRERKAKGEVVTLLG